MRNAGIFWGMAALAFAFTSSGSDFPLQFKSLTAKESISFPGSYGAIGSLRALKPNGLRSEPEAAARNPVYGELAGSEERNRAVFRLEESKGAGQGYDRLILDLNENGDLTDDPVVPRLPEVELPKTSTRMVDRALFGPVPVVVPHLSGKTDYFAEIVLYERRSPARDPKLEYRGYLRLRPGWYLEATVELDGIKHKVGVVDGQANRRLGDVSEPRTYRSGREEHWYFATADAYLVDANGSGTFDDDRFGSETSPCSPVLYLGTAPFRVALAADLAALRVEPWTGKLAEVEVEPGGATVSRLDLAWKCDPDSWRLLRVPVRAGTARVPAGSYRFFGCMLSAESDGDVTALGAFYRKLDKQFAADAGKKTSLRCGSPLEIQVTTEKRTGPSAVTGDSEEEALEEGVEYADLALRLNGLVVGAAGETYSTFAKGKDLTTDPPKPTFAILDKAGREIQSGNLEFG